MRLKDFTQFCPISIYVLLMSTSLQAQDFLPRNGFWAGLDLGGARLEQTSDVIDYEGATFHMAFKGDYWLSKHILAGLELSGWLAAGK